MSRKVVGESALKAWADASYKGTVVGATGIGKTKIAIDAISNQFTEEPNSNVLIVIPFQTLRDDGWPDEFKKWEVPDFTDKTTRVCYTSLHKMTAGNWHLVILDEVHHITPANAPFFEYNTVLRILGLTATFPSNRSGLSADVVDMDAIKYEILMDLCPPVYKMTVDQAVEQGIVADFEVKVCKFYLDAVTKNIPGGTVKKPFITTEKVQYGYLTRQLSFFAMKASIKPSMRGAMFPWMQRRMAFIYNLPSKMRLAKQCLERLQENGKRTIVFCGSIEQSNELCGNQVYNSQTDDVMLQKFQNKEIDTLGAVRALDEGINLVDVDHALVVSLTSKERAITQRIGRVIRQRDGHKGLIVVLIALQTVDEKWYESAFENFDRKRIREFIVRVPDIKSEDLPANVEKSALVEQP